MWLFIAFLAVPLIEIALFIQVGGLIGLWPTLAVVVLTAILGTWLVRSQGLMALEDIKRSFNEFGDPAEPLAHGAMILFSGALLLTPGFFTDTVGFLLLAPPVRRAAYRWLRARMHVVHAGPSGPTRPEAQRGGPPPGRGDVIDGTWSEAETDDARPRRDGPSGWTQPRGH